MCLNRLKREETRGGSERFVESSYQLMGDMISRILDQIGSPESSRMNPNTSAPPSLPISLSPNRSSSDRYEDLIAENKRLSMKIKDFAASSYRESSRSDEEMVTIRVPSPPLPSFLTPPLQNRCETLVKERQAVHTIMEQKIKVLVQSVAQAVSVVLHSSQGGGPTGHALAKVRRNRQGDELTTLRMWRRCKDLSMPPSQL